MYVTSQNNRFKESVINKSCFNRVNLVTGLFGRDLRLKPHMYSNKA